MLKYRFSFTVMKKMLLELGGVSLHAQTFEIPHSVGYHPHQKIESSCPSPYHRPAHIETNGISYNF